MYGISGNYEEIRANANDMKVINSEQQVFNQIKNYGNNKEQLKKVATEFESVFITKMLSTMEKLVDKEDGALENNGKYLDTFKSYMYQELGRDLASNPRTSFGLAKQIYEQMEKHISE